MRLPLRSPLVAVWLYGLTVMIVAMVMVGGATRLTDSGLSITQWKPIDGTMPPVTAQDWQTEFDHYKRIPEYKVVNHDMTIEEFKVIYWWEWGHRLLGRILGLLALFPFIFFLATSEVPGRIVWRGCVIIAGIGVQGALGWWMVSSGLANRVDVAPERLTVHLGTAVLLLMFTLWTAFETVDGQGRGRGAPTPWRIATGALLGLVYIQVLLGALVAGNDAGLVYNDWPLMNGSLFPPVDWSKGVGYSLIHDQGVVQVMHRFGAYALLAIGTGYLIAMLRHCVHEGLRSLTLLFFGLLLVQALLGIATLMMAVPLWLAIAHQFTAILLVMLTTLLFWQVLRTDRVFR